MNPRSVKPKNYQHHREHQRERILEAAEKLFIRDGLDQVSMSSIAGAARMARITLYEYFSSKEEIAWAIFQKLVEESKTLFSGQNQAPGSGFQQLEALAMQLVSYLQGNPEHARFIVEFNTLYARESNPARLVGILRQTWQGFGNLFEDAIRRGIADGSIRADVEPNLATAALLNMINAVISRFSLLGSLVSEEYGQPAQAMVQEIFRTYLRGIQSANKTA